MPKHVKKTISTTIWTICMKVQVGQKSLTLWDGQITMISWYVYTQYHTFLIKCAKGNKMKKVTLKIDNIHFFGQLPKCMMISSLINKLMLISHPMNKIYFYFPPSSSMTDIQYKRFLLLVISKISTTLAGDWWNRQWFCGG